MIGFTPLSKTKVDKIGEVVERLVNFGYTAGFDALLKKKVVIRITTGSQALDELLNDGIETLAIAEAFGEIKNCTEEAHRLVACSTVYK